MSMRVGHSGSRTLWRLIDPLILDDWPATEIWTVPAKFETSLGYGDPAHASATIRNYLWSLKRLPPKLINEIFYRALLAERVPRWRAWLMYQTERLPIGRMGRNR